METYQGLFIALGVLVMGAFAGGVIWNIRRGNAILHWMQGGLPSIGEKTTLRWLGSSVVELNIGKAKPPFRRFALVLVLQPRDVPWLWLWSLARNRRDMVILRGALTSAPRLEYDLIAAESWTGRSTLSSAQSAKWGTQPVEELTFAAPKASLPVSSAGVQPILQAARQLNPTIWRLSARREYPQLELHLPMPSPNADARQYFEALRLLAREMMAD
jgi:hypothetical protein